MKVLYGEDVASHAGPKPCVVSREGHDEASAGERVGWPLSRVRPKSRVPTALPSWKATRPAAQMRVVGDPARSETPACTDASCTGTERSHTWPVAQAAGPRREGEEP